MTRRAFDLYATERRFGQLIVGVGAWVYLYRRFGRRRKGGR